MTEIGDFIFLNEPTVTEESQAPTTSQNTLTASKVAQPQSNQSTPRMSSQPTQGVKRTRKNRIKRTSDGVERTSSSEVKSLDPKSRLEKSRQSARECRARKKLRYQYLEELVKKREQAVIELRKELDSHIDICRKIDDGILPVEASKMIYEDDVHHHLHLHCPTSSRTRKK